MANTFPEQRTPNTKYMARYIQSSMVQLPAEKIDLYKWAIAMTDADYTSYSPSHKAMGSFVKDNMFYMTNVENIGTDTLVQNYELRYHTANHIQLYSPKSKAYIMRWFPTTVGVPWELYIKPVSATSCRLTCMIGVDYPGFVLKTASWLSSFGGLFLRQHLLEECKAFAKDIEAKFK